MPAVEELMEVQHVRITSTDLASVSPPKKHRSEMVDDQGSPLKNRDLLIILPEIHVFSAQPVLV